MRIRSSLATCAAAAIAAVAVATLIAATPATARAQQADATPPAILPGDGPFTPSPIFSADGFALAVYQGSSIDGLQAAAGDAGATGAWVQDASGVYRLLPAGAAAPAFLTGAFEAAIPSIEGPIAVTLVRPPTPPTASPITLEQDGATLTLRVGQRVLLMLGEAFLWDVAPFDTRVVERVPNVTVVRGAQGIYEAVGVGSTDLSATGDPPCRQSEPACGAPSRLFRVHLVVTP